MMKADPGKRLLPRPVLPKAAGAKGEPPMYDFIRSAVTVQVIAAAAPCWRCLRFSAAAAPAQAKAPRCGSF